MSWQDLTNIALLGTDNSTFPEQVLVDLQERGVNVQKEAPLVLAEAVALFSQLRKAGFQLADFEGQLPRAAGHAEERVCSIRSAHHLYLMLNGAYGNLLPEFFALLIQNKKHLPPEHLPRLLNHPDKNNWSNFLKDTLSSGGRWLLSQHPEWQNLLEKPETDWHTGSREERLHLLAYLRQHDPQAGLELLQSTWQEEPQSDKRAFLSVLKSGLSLADEPFLEHCLDEKRKELRQEAAALLQALPASRLVGRMFERASQCLKQDGKKLRLNIPENIDAGALRDGLLKTSPKWKGGARATYLGQVVSAVPPAQWEAFFKKTPVEIVQLFAGTDWPDTLLLACTQASVKHVDEAWMEVLLSHWLHTERQGRWGEDVFIGPLLKAASTATVNRLAIQHLEKQRSLPGANTLVFQLLKSSERAWEDRLTLLVVSKLQTWLSNASNISWQFSEKREYLDFIALRCNPALFEELQKGWDSKASQWAFWEKPVEEMLNTLLFRREMRKELEKNI